MSLKKIKAAQNRLTNASRSAVKTINELTENSLVDSGFEKEPLNSLGLLVGHPSGLANQATIDEEYAGMIPEEAEEAHQAERAEEREQLQAQKRLSAFRPVVEEPTDAESAGDAGEELTDGKPDGGLEPVPPVDLFEDGEGPEEDEAA